MIASASKLPPQNLDAEVFVLGGMLLDNEAISRVIEFIEPDDFYREAHRKIYQAILTLYQANEPSDILTISNILKQEGSLEAVGGASFVATLVDKTPTAAPIVHYAKIIKEKSILRRLIDGATQIVERGYGEEGGVDEFLDQAERIIFEIASKHVQQGFHPIKELVKSSFRAIELLYEKKELLTGVATGFTDLDRLTSGLQASDLIVVAGRPSSGKTAFALSCAANAALDHKVPSAIFSLEMSKEQLVQRLLCSKAQVDSYKLRGGFLSESDWPKLTRAAGALSEAPIFIDDSPTLTVLEMRAKARRLKKEKNLGLLVVDYLQLVRSPGRYESREREISEISRGLKALAKELHIPVVALSQLNRGVENRQDKRPMLSDLRESGCLTGDTLITNAKTGEQHSIKSLAERNEQTPFPVFAMDDNYRVGSHHLVKAFFSGRKQVFLLRMRSGRKIKASANHPFFRIDGWKHLSELQAGDAIALPRTMSILQPHKSLSDHEIILLAHLLGDGCILPHQPYHYTSSDRENIETVRKSAKKLFGIKGRVVLQKNWWHLYLPSPYRLARNRRHPITDWFSKLGITPVHSWEKQIPNRLFQSPPQDISLFLKHLWATDGNFSWKKLDGRKMAGAIYYASSSEMLASQVQHLLLMLDIHSTLRSISSKKGYRMMYHVAVDGAEEQLKFCERVGMAGNRKTLVPKLIAALREIKQNKNVDVIPSLAWKIVIEPVKKRVGIGWREFSERLGMEYCGSSLLKNGISRIRMLLIAQALEGDEILRNLAGSDLFWDKLESITPLGVEDVYDATVEGVHNFVANDILVHNSIEQDADIVMMIYRDEMYNPESLDAGKAEIIIAKQRNGPTGKTMMTFLSKYTRFDNLARGSDEFAPPISEGVEDVAQDEAPF